MKSDNPKFPMVFHDIGPRPIEIQNEAHLKQECDTRGLSSYHLLNKMNPRGRKVYAYNKETGKVERIK